MSNLINKIILYLERTPDFKEEVKLKDDGLGEGMYIAEWNAKDKAKPTDEQLNALESKATKLENNNKIRATRRNLYGDIGDQLDEIFKDIDTWKTRIQKIKTDNPKE
tara:strand:- start:241 stop:561 length:321 start_codon:yes stop_codon:yes gene_type:complete